MKNKLKKDIILACKIHTMEEEVFGGGPKDEVKKKNQKKEDEAHSIF